MRYFNKMVFIWISIQTQGDQVYNSTTKHGKMWYYPLTSIEGGILNNSYMS
jgi:hypothetical protein